MYQLIETLPDGHRLFTRRDKSGILIADESGLWPDQTDDGELWLNMKKFLLIEQEDSETLKTHYSIPLHDAAGKPTRTPTDSATIFRLAVLIGWRINVATKAESVIYEVAIAAGQFSGQARTGQALALPHGS